MQTCELIFDNNRYLCSMIAKLLSPILFFFVACSAVMNAAEQWHHIVGLPCEETSSITQDADGFIYFGTRLGLVRYDGYQCVMYRNDIVHPHLFSSCDIKSLAADDSCRVFAGAFYGLNTLSPSAQTISINHFGEDDYINALRYDKKGRLWVGTYNGVYVQGRDGDFNYVRGFPKDLVLQFCESRESQMYVVTQNNGIYFVGNNNECRAVPSTQDLRPRALGIDADGTFWIGTERRGLWSIQSGTASHHAGFDGYEMNDLLLSKDYQHIYIATDKGVLTINTRSMSSAKDAVSLENKHVTSLYADRDGNVWAATESDGIWFLHNQHQTFNVQERLFTHQTTPIMSQFDVRHLGDTLLWRTIPNINSLYEASDGTTFIGTWNDGLYVSRQGDIKHHLTKSNTSWLKNNGIYGISSLADGSILFATWVGLYIIEPDYTSGRSVEQIGATQIGEIHTLTMARLDENDVWMGMVGGIAHIKFKDHDWQNGTVTLYTHVNQAGIMQPNNLGAMANAQNEGTAYRLGGIYRILQDNHGRIWACTSEPGLLLYNKECDRFECVSSELGILGDNVHSFDIDERGDFWMTTNFGILRMYVDSEGRVLKRHLYTQQDGLPKNYYGSTVSTRLADGCICFLNQQCLITLRPERNPAKDDECNALISEFQINGQPLMRTKRYGASLPHHITLNHDQNNISIHFSALAFGEEASIRYAYKLEGVDGDYLQTAMGSNSINYNRLPPGTYKLHYAVASGTMNDDESGQTLTITILQPLWWRWWARLFYVLLASLIAYVIIHSIIDRNRKHHQLEILAVEKHSLDEQYRKMTRFYVKVIHTFLTPVTLMSEQIRELQKKVRPSLQASLLILSAQTQQLQDSMNEIIKVKDDDSIREAMQKAQELTQTDRDFLRRCIESVNQHLADADYTHQVLMSDVGASHATLYRKLKQLTGMDATSFIRSIRMKAACQILAQDPNIRINELADRVGYSNSKYFSTCFKTEFGMSPREYQNSQ